jgi:hypothetical protein
MTTSQRNELLAARYQRERLRQRSSIEKIHNSSSYASPGFIIALSLTLMAAIALFAAALQITTVDAFVARQVPIKRHSSNTKIFLEGTLLLPLPLLFSLPPPIVHVCRTNSFVQTRSCSHSFSFPIFLVYVSLIHPVGKHI